MNRRPLLWGVDDLIAIVGWDGGRVFGLSTELLLEALPWPTDERPDRGPTRSAELAPLVAEA
ncbi:MAG: hypothetical protein AAEJ52_08180 [Myxococcota bacterium]